MPETQEATASVKQAKLAGNAASFVLERLVVDATKAEAKMFQHIQRGKCLPPLRSGLQRTKCFPRPTFAFHEAKEMLSISRTFPSNYALEFGYRTFYLARVQSNILPIVPNELLGHARTIHLIKYRTTNTLKVPTGGLVHSVDFRMMCGGLSTKTKSDWQ
ncbi:hypothetical protein K438DRAFT_1786847 [Mycena galopus ATCC 62051]|nr:hypothetical protein K438DRAFT_1786847 [Mycena galopus ATCC 62051]